MSEEMPVFILLAALDCSEVRLSARSRTRDAARLSDKLFSCNCDVHTYNHRPSRSQKRTFPWTAAIPDPAQH